MTKIEKLLDKLIQSSEKLYYREIEKILKYIGFTKIQAKGSHIKFKYAKQNIDIIIPIHNNDCKNFYKKLTAKIIQNIINNP